MVKRSRLRCKSSHAPRVSSRETCIFGGVFLALWDGGVIDKPLSSHCTRPDPSELRDPHAPFFPTLPLRRSDVLVRRQGSTHSRRQKRPGEVAVDSHSHTLAFFCLLSPYHTSCQVDGDSSCSSLLQTILFSLQPLLIPQNVNVRPSPSTFNTPQAIIGFCLHASPPKPVIRQS